jgi:alpha-tubulin suppressor-like RCC1 family protein
MRTPKMKHTALALWLVVMLASCGGEEVTAPVSAARLSFMVQPSDAVAGMEFSAAIKVAIQDAEGRTITNARDVVTLALGPNSGSAVLLGTKSVAAVAGVATFTDVRIDRHAAGLTLVASAGQITAASNPFKVTLKFESISAGWFHTCAVTISHAAYCWGANTFGMLGDGTTTSRTSPVMVEGGFSFASISAGYDHTCAVTTAGAAYCWGGNESGQLGDGTRTMRTTPTPVSGGLVFQTVGAGNRGEFSCGLATSGAAYCWGSNFIGRLGDGTEVDRTTPVPVAGGRRYTALSVGHGHACALESSGAAYCWGFNQGDGRLGDGTMTNRSVPVAVVGGLRFTSISASEDYTCATTAGGTIYCWGYNLYGHLGVGGMDVKLVPTAVQGSVNLVSVTTGYSHRCGRTSAGAVYCWGFNNSGQLGNGTNMQQFSPTAVSGGLTFANVSAGAHFTCGVTAAGGAYCWGSNLAGTLGDGSTIERTTPVSVVP